MYKVVALIIAVFFTALTNTSANAAEVTFSVQSLHPNRVQLEFYSVTNRRRAWPGNGKVYSLRDSLEHHFKLECKRGEKICYGAWVDGNPDAYWGAGYNGQHGCSSCCTTCNGGITEDYVLNP